MNFKEAIATESRETVENVDSPERLNTAHFSEQQNVAS